MQTNPWLAIDAATSPRALARATRKAWEQFVLEGAPAGVRAPIAASWLRSQAAGISPTGEHAAPLTACPDEVEARWEVHPLAGAVPLINECLGMIADQAEHLMVVSDVDGTLLWVQGNGGVRVDAAEELNFKEGAAWTERAAGTNAIGTAIAEEHAVQVFAAEHFNETVQPWTCAAAPVRDPETGRLLGVIDLTARMTTANPHSFTCVVATAKAVEALLLAQMNERDARLRARFGGVLSGPGQRMLLAPSGRVIATTHSGRIVGERVQLPPGGGEIVLASGERAFAEPLGHEQAYVLGFETGARAAKRASRCLRMRLLGQSRAQVELDGSSLELRPRHGELLTLLALHGDGMTSEQLALALYGENGQPGAVRVEISRLRKILGDVFDTDCYRLTVPVESDAAVTGGLLARGEVRRAAESYQGVLLPASEAPGIVREREALDSWLRQAVLRSGDSEALWAWVQQPSGSDDLQVWKRLIAAIPFHDPRRTLAASRIKALRAELSL